MENRLELNNKPVWEIPGLEIQKITTKKGKRVTVPKFNNPDIRMIAWGVKCGKILEENDRAYASEIWIKCNEVQKKQILSIDWVDFVKNTATAFYKSGKEGRNMANYQITEKLYKEFYNKRD